MGIFYLGLDSGQVGLHIKPYKSEVLSCIRSKEWEVILPSNEQGTV
jgi:hypothetical protein